MGTTILIGPMLCACFLLGKERWEYLIGTTPQPTYPKADGYDQSVAKWDKENAKVLTWFHNYVEPSIGMNFSKYDTAKQVWDYLKTMDVESNFVKQYELEMCIRSAK